MAIKCFHGVNMIEKNRRNGIKITEENIKETKLVASKNSTYKGNKIKNIIKSKIGSLRRERQNVFSDPNADSLTDRQTNIHT